MFSLLHMAVRCTFICLKLCQYYFIIKIQKPIPSSVYGFKESEQSAKCLEILQFTISRKPEQRDVIWNSV